jgi:hypothetical protein
MESLAEIRQDPPHLFSFVQKSGKVAGIYFASGENQDSVISACSSCCSSLDLKKNKDGQSLRRAG